MGRATELVTELLGPPKTNEHVKLVRSNEPPPWDGDLLNVGCGPFYAPGWRNLDVIREPDHGILPDVLLECYDRLPFPDGAAGAVYLGHVLEHIRWEAVDAYLREVGRVLAPGAPVCVVGPDVYRAIEMWSAGDLDRDWLEAVLENEASYQDAGMWDGARHQWNCNEGRVVLALRRAGFVDVEGVALESPRLDLWPVTSRIDWQCAVMGRKPSDCRG